MTTTIIMTTEKMEEAIKLIKSYQAVEQEIRELREAKEEEIRKILDASGLEELQVGAFTVRFTNVVRNNFNTSAFKKKYFVLLSFMNLNSSYYCLVLAIFCIFSAYLLSYFYFHIFINICVLIMVN